MTSIANNVSRLREGTEPVAVVGWLGRDAIVAREDLSRGLLSPEVALASALPELLAGTRIPVHLERGGNGASDGWRLLGVSGDATTGLRFDVERDGEVAQARIAPTIAPLLASLAPGGATDTAAIWCVLGQVPSAGGSASTAELVTPARYPMRGAVEDVGRGIRVIAETADPAHPAADALNDLRWTLAALDRLPATLTSSTDHLYLLEGASGRGQTTAVVTGQSWPDRTVTLYQRALRTSRADATREGKLVHELAHQSGRAGGAPNGAAWARAVDSDARHVADLASRGAQDYFNLAVLGTDDHRWLTRYAASKSTQPQRFKEDHADGTALAWASARGLTIATLGDDADLAFEDVAPDRAALVARQHPGLAAAGRAAGPYTDIGPSHTRRGW